MQSQISKLKIVIVNGRPRAGKTTFESMCEQILGRAYCERRSTVDKIKEIATEGGWKGGKELKDRKFLSDLKDLFTEYNDMPLANHADEGVFDYDYDYIIYNDGSIHKLYDEAQRFLNSIFSEF